MENNYQKYLIYIDGNHICGVVERFFLDLNSLYKVSL